MANSGCQDDAAATEALFVDCFAGFDTIVGPSASCVHHVRLHLDAIEQTPAVHRVRAGTRELVEFLCGIGSCGVPRLGLGDYVAGQGPGARRTQLESASVGYSLEISPHNHHKPRLRATN